MYQQVFDNQDLLRHIYSFGDPDHRAFTKNLQWDLKAHPEQFVERYHEKKQMDGVHYTIKDYLHEFSTAQLESYVHTYKRCFCCMRHHTNKPMWVRKRSGNLRGKHVHTSPSVFENQSTECNCWCRTLTRSFIRHLRLRESTNP